MSMKYNTINSTSSQPLLYFHNEKQQMFVSPNFEDYRYDCIMSHQSVTSYLSPKATFIETVFR